MTLLSLLGRQFVVEVDPRSLESGAHYAQVWLYTVEPQYNGTQYTNPKHLDLLLYTILHTLRFQYSDLETKIISWHDFDDHMLVGHLNVQGKFRCTVPSGGVVFAMLNFLTKNLNQWCS